jgi:predicted esterase
MDYQHKYLKYKHKYFMSKIQNGGHSNVVLDKTTAAFVKLLPTEPPKTPNETNAALVFVNYTPTPEAQYPTQIDQAYNATRYIAEHANELNIDADNLVVVGDSVGGNMAAVVTLMAKQYYTPKIKYQVLAYPVTSTSMNTESYKKFANGQ